MKIDKRIIKILLENNWSISTAESCTGGFLAHTITNASGSSDYFSNGYVTYSDEAKINDLNIPKEILDEFSSYSGKVAELMAEGARKNTKSNFGLAITGIAPPGDPSSNLQTGTIFFGLSSPLSVKYCKYVLEEKSREKFKFKAVKIAISLLEDFISNYKQEF
jgi:PncC family amidohydrolase